MARIVVIEKRLQNRVEIVMAKTRTTDSPYYAVNPSGRVPYLVRDDGVGMEESAVICAYLDQLDGKPSLDVQGWEARRLEGLARSYLDGLSVWMRELYRPPQERSPGLIKHETERAARLADTWEHEVGHALMRGPLNMIQLTLACALAIELRMPELDWRSGHPRLQEWYEAIARWPSFKATEPPRPAAK